MVVMEGAAQRQRELADAGSDGALAGGRADGPLGVLLPWYAVQRSPGVNYLHPAG